MVPWSRNLIRRLSGAAAKKREDVEFVKHAEQQIPGIDSPMMIHFGPWGSETTI